MTIKVTTSIKILTLALSLSASASLAMEAPDEAEPPREGYPAPKEASLALSRSATQVTYSPYPHLCALAQVEIQELRDTYADSASFTMAEISEARRERQHSLSQSTGHTEVRRILQLDGGGVRGMFTIIELSVLEEIINHPRNRLLKEELLAKKSERLAVEGKTDDVSRLYIRDLFDVGAGTSTGSIITAGLFSQANLSAIQVAQLYTRYGYKIFGEQKQAFLPFGLMNATYSNQGLMGLLTHYFGNRRLEEVHKPIYIVANNETKQEAAIFSSQQIEGDADNLYKTPLVSAVLASSSAPTYFPGIHTPVGSGQVFLSDGGTVANNAAYLAYNEETKLRANPFEIYSFGTGSLEAPAVRHQDSGALSVLTILQNTLVASERLALKYCMDEIKKINSQLFYFARINPKLEAGMDKLDDTSDAYIGYAIKKALSVTQGAAFKDMVSKLGFEIDTNLLNEAHTAVLHKLQALKSKNYHELDRYEQEFVISKVLNLDFEFYQKGFYLDSTSDFKQMTDAEAQRFLFDLMEDIKVRKQQAGNEFLARMWSLISTDEKDNIMEFIPRSLSFHGLSKGINILDANGFALLTQEHKPFSQEQLRRLSPGRIINGDGRFYRGSAAETNDTNQLMTDLLLTFIDLCVSSQGNYKYETSQSAYIQLPALIFWKNTLFSFENQLTRHDLLKFRNNFEKYLYEIISSRARVSTFAASTLYGMRYGVMLKALDTYINKFFKE
ncbi:patatin-like phospholipase family protein [Candidatus Odyssella thessalonicensis]|uniref:patatin-like phospholipase family protein n=1 Tax=Candidatus Odyssella thessalonicensis TaxID=84647 RepID=UPI000225A8AC|nr:patatin-like phospholipase family protein [Candidatus Odyssella thessalonicensis]